MNGEHKSRELASGEEVHLVKEPNDQWAISSYDWSVLRGQLPLTLVTAKADIKALGWDKMRFPTPDAAYDFVATKIKNRQAPGTHTPIPGA
jgi:hypothetical protein